MKNENILLESKEGLDIDDTNFEYSFRDKWTIDLSNP